MTLSEVVSMVLYTVQNDAIEGIIPERVNAALREIQDIHSWDEMKKTSTPVTVTAGSLPADLPADFKEFQNTRYPATVVEAGGTFRYPVYTAQELEKLRVSLRPARHFIFQQRSGAVSRLLLSVAKGANISVSVDYFGYITPMVLGSVETHLLLTNYPNMVLSKTFSLVYQFLNDDAFMTYEKTFANEVKNNSGKDIKASYPQPRPDKE